MKYLVSVFIIILLFPIVASAQTVTEGVNRTSCVAPCAIVFNADLYTSGVSERRNHDYRYAWDFDDTGAGNWHTGHSKETDTGPVTGHIYESAGTYNPTLTVYSDAATTVPAEAYTVTITVTDDDTYYATTATTCINDSTPGTDFTGCPAGANQVTTDNLSDISAYTQVGERVLLHRGSVWNETEILLDNNDGPVTISAYGTCTSPDDLGICSNAPVINVTGINTNYVFNLNNRENFRIMDLKIDGDDVMDSAFYGTIGKMQNHLIMRNEITDFRTNIGFSHWRSNLINDVISFNFVVENDISSATSNNIYFGSEYLAVLGNKSYDAQGSHSVRIWQSYIGTISHNAFSGANITNAQRRHALKLHGPSETILGLGDGGVLDNRTAFTVVYDNVFGTSGPWPLSVGPQNGEEDERLTDIIIERNRQLADYGTKSQNDVIVGAYLAGRYFTARNNIFMGEAGSVQFIGIAISRRGIEPDPIGVECYNNTIYAPGNKNDDYYGIKVHADVTSTVLRNNLASFPNAVGPHAMLLDSAADTVASNNLLTDTPYWTDSDNVTPLSRDFSVTSSGTASIDQGYAVPVFDDFIGTSRPQNSLYDIGAYEYYVAQAQTRSIGKLAPSRAFIK